MRPVNDYEWKSLERMSRAGGDLGIVGHLLCDLFKEHVEEDLKKEKAKLRCMHACGGGKSVCTDD